MRNKKAQMEVAVMKGLAIALVIIGGFYLYERISGLTNEGKPIICEWNCESVKWSECFNGYQYRDTGLCNSQEGCRCNPNDSRCFDSNAKPVTKRNC